VLVKKLFLHESSCIAMRRMAVGRRATWPDSARNGPWPRSLGRKLSLYRGRLRMEPCRSLHRREGRRKTWGVGGPVRRF
jgi:hypothetical protein